MYDAGLVPSARGGAVPPRAASVRCRARARPDRGNCLLCCSEFTGLHRGDCPAGPNARRGGGPAWGGLWLGSCVRAVLLRLRQMRPERSMLPGCVVRRQLGTGAQLGGVGRGGFQSARIPPRQRGRRHRVQDHAQDDGPGRHRGQHVGLLFRLVQRLDRDQHEDHRRQTRGPSQPITNTVSRRSPVPLMLIATGTMRTMVKARRAKTKARASNYRTSGTTRVTPKRVQTRVESTVPPSSVNSVASRSR